MATPFDPRNPSVFSTLPGGASGPPQGLPSMGSPSGALGAIGGPAGAITMGAGAGLDILGNVMNASAANQASNRQWQLIQSELARRNAIQSGMAPGLMTSAGITDPQQRAQILGATSGQSVGEGGAGAQQPTVTSAHMMPGQTHKNANDIVRGVENPFGQQMAQISQGGGKLEDLKAAYETYLRGIQNFKTSGGANSQVAQQSLNNPALGQTFKTLWSQLGGGNAPILGQPAS